VYCDHPAAGRLPFHDAGVTAFTGGSCHHTRLAGDPALDPLLATTVVRPDALVRTHPQGITETLRLFDGEDVVEVKVDGAKGGTALRLTGDTVAAVQIAPGSDEYTATQKAGSNIVDHIAVGHSGNSFLIAVGSSREAARKLLARAVVAAPAWSAERRARLEGVISGDHYLASTGSRLTEALRWLQLTTDSLVTRQRGEGIYAGLPWFNEYWGRDSFISLPGATLVTGHFEEARAILASFAAFQDLDRASRFYGRLPNIVKPGSIDYHTTDGTPRWVIGLRDYVRCTGDRSIVIELYPDVKASIEGALTNFTDASGYLVHADNEAWMDARRVSRGRTCRPGRTPSSCASGTRTFWGSSPTWSRAGFAWRRGCQRLLATSNSIRGSAAASCTNRMSVPMAAGSTRGDCRVRPRSSTSTSFRSNGARSPLPPATLSMSSRRRAA
jgi:hypothetical protein